MILKSIPNIAMVEQYRLEWSVKLVDHQTRRNVTQRILLRNFTGFLFL